MTPLSDETVLVTDQDFVALLEVAEEQGRAEEFTSLWFGDHDDKDGWQGTAHLKLVQMMTDFCKARPELRERVNRFGWEYPPGDLMVTSDPAPSSESVHPDETVGDAEIASPQRSGKKAQHRLPKQPECRTRTAVELMSMQFPDPAWAVHGLIPEGLSVLAGKPKLGKSWLALQVAVAVASGNVILGDHRVEQGAVLYLALEDTDRRLQDRLKKVLREAPVPDDFHYATDWPRMSVGGASGLKKWLEAQAKPRLVIVDTLACVRSGSGTSSTQYEDDYRATQEFKQIADAFGVAVVLVHHVRKMGADDPFDTVAGTVGLTGAADAILLLQRERNRSHGKLAVTGRDVEELALDLLWNPEAGLWTADSSRITPPVSEERRRIVEVLGYAAAPKGPKEVASTLDRDYNGVRQLMWQMERDGQLVRIKGKYALPDNLDNVTNEASLTDFEEPASDVDEIQDFEELDVP